MMFEGEKDIPRAAIRLADIDHEIAALKRERLEVEEWLLDVMTSDRMDTPAGTLVRRRRPRFAAWRNDDFRKDALRASATLDDHVETFANPETGETRRLVDETYRKGWDAAHRVVTLSGDRAKKGALQLLGLNPSEYSEMSWHTSVELEDTEP